MNWVSELIRAVSASGLTSLFLSVERVEVIAGRGGWLHDVNCPPNTFMCGYRGECHQGGGKEEGTGILPNGPATHIHVGCEFGQLSIYIHVSSVHLAK